MNQAVNSPNAAGNPAVDKGHDQEHHHDPAHDAGHLTEEADIGSGEPSPGKQETDEAIRSIPALPKDGGQAPAAAKVSP